MAYRELDRLRRAYAASEEQRALAVQVAMFAIAALGRTELTMASLRRQLEVQHANQAADQGRDQGQGQVEERLREQLLRAQGQIKGLDAARVQAERERADALSVSDEALRRIAALEADLAMRVGSGPAGQDAAAGSDLVPGPVQRYRPDPADPEMDAVDEFLGQARTRLDEGREAVIDAVHDAGLSNPEQAHTPGAVIVGTVLPHRQAPASDGATLATGHPNAELPALQESAPAVERRSLW